MEHKNKMKPLGEYIIPVYTVRDDAEARHRGYKELIRCEYCKHYRSFYCGITWRDEAPSHWCADGEMQEEEQEAGRCD